MRLWVCDVVGTTLRIDEAKANHLIVFESPFDTMVRSMAVPSRLTPVSLLIEL